jgi:ATP synthase protein I
VFLDRVPTYETKMPTSEALQAKRILIGQLALALVLTAAAVPFGKSAAVSVLIGGGTCFLASTVFAFRVFRQYRAQRPDVLVMRFYGAEVVKLAMVLGLFTLAFATVDGLNLPALLAAYLAVQVLPFVVAPNWGAGPKRGR